MKLNHINPEYEKITQTSLEKIKQQIQSGKIVDMSVYMLRTTGRKAQKNNFLFNYT